VLLLYAIAAGLIAGRLMGGRLRNLERVSFVWWQLALAGLAVQLVLFAAPVAERIGSLGPGIYIISTLAVLAALLRNLRLPGLPIIAVGAGLNLVAILANGGHMPSSPQAWLELTGAASLPVAHYTNVALIGPDTLFPFLGDIFVLPRPLPMATVFSLGDAIIAAGAIVFLVVALRGPRLEQVRLAGADPKPGPQPVQH
jgi:hypothetical protein